jgi:predicted transposase/invertase (TIGR01784 family)
MNKRLDPKLDLVFKLLFGGPNSQEILISLLTAVIRPPVPIKSVTVLNPEIPGELTTARGIRLDVHVLLQDGRHVDVEMQSKSRGGIRKRALFYWSRLYDTQLRRGVEYKKLQPCICVFLLRPVGTARGGASQAARSRVDPEPARG